LFFAVPTINTEATTLQDARRIAQSKRGATTKVQVTTDSILDSTDPGHQAGTMTVIQLTPGPKQAGAKTFAAVVSTPKAPITTTPTQVSAKVQTPTKPLQAKPNTKKAPPNKGERPYKKGPNQPMGKGNLKPKPVSMIQKIADVNKQVTNKAKQADSSDSPKMKKPFGEVTKPTKTTKRIVETPDGKGYHLLSEGEKRKTDVAKLRKEIGLLDFSDDEEDELSL